VETKRSMKLHK